MRHQTRLSNHIKIDHSSGGVRVFECRNEVDIRSLSEDVFKDPILVQKKIDGELVDLLSFFQQGKQIHFDYCKIVKTINGKFGPSSMRHYYQPYLAEREKKSRS